MASIQMSETALSVNLAENPLFKRVYQASAAFSSLPIANKLIILPFADSYPPQGVVLCVVAKEAEK